MINKSFITEGVRETNDDFWEQIRHLDMFGSKAHTLCPFIVVMEGKILVFVKKDDLLEQNYPDNTMIIKAWPGEWRTDYFHFTLKELKAH